MVISVTNFELLASCKVVICISLCICLCCSSVRWGTWQQRIAFSLPFAMYIRSCVHVYDCEYVMHWYVPFKTICASSASCIHVWGNRLWTCMRIYVSCVWACTCICKFQQSHGHGHGHGVYILAKHPGKSDVQMFELLAAWCRECCNILSIHRRLQKTHINSYIYIHVYMCIYKPWNIMCNARNIYIYIYIHVYIYIYIYICSDMHAYSRLSELEFSGI